MSTQRRAHEILEFWFGLRPYTAAGVEMHMRQWFGDAHAPELQPQFDETLRLRFGALVKAAAGGNLSAWESSPRRRLALILLLDQFPRNIHRGTAQAFASDRDALLLTVGGMQLGADAALDPLERMFFYMPMQHSESPEVQEESVAAFGRLASEAPEELRATFAAVKKFAGRHRDIVQRFGRFPHRNRVLGRDNSREEQLWLASEGQHFGQ
jgi:uncharacterized protein (DUF924 family)